MTTQMAKTMNSADVTDTVIGVLYAWGSPSRCRLKHVARLSLFEAGGEVSS
jgi:hypothetical protein